MYAIRLRGFKVRSSQWYPQRHSHFACELEKQLILFIEKLEAKGSIKFLTGDVFFPFRDHHSMEDSIGGACLPHWGAPLMAAFCFPGLDTLFRI